MPRHPSDPLSLAAGSEVSPSLLATFVLCGILIIYTRLQDFVKLPPIWEVVFVMIPGAILGPGYRETLQNAFGTSGIAGEGRGFVARVRNRAASLVGAAAIPGGYDGGGEGLVGGLWNTGNTCYQNSILQAMASLSHLRPHLAALSISEMEDNMNPSGVLMSLITALNELTPNPRASTPSPIIARGPGGSGWIYNEQQDAQEFFQKLTGALEKEVTRLLDRRKYESAVGLETVLELEQGDNAEETGGKKRREANHLELKTKFADKTMRSPFEGLLAQRVGCLKCGYVEAISLQPFTSLSLPMPSSRACSLEECLSEFTSIEKIPEVGCEKCTLISLHSQLETLIDPPFPRSTEVAPELPPRHLPAELKAQFTSRLKALSEALENDDFTPKIPGFKIMPKQKVFTTKTKHIMIARPPPVLVLHMNRSQFDIVTGMTGKNYAAVSFPPTMDLGRMGVITRHDTAGGCWGLGVDPARPISGRLPKPVQRPAEDDGKERTDDECRVRNAELERSDENAVYTLKSVIAHYGGHHNGHYVCYREYGTRWFKISDHEVYSCDKEDALRAGNAFMLFYEKIAVDQDEGGSKAEEVVVNGVAMKEAAIETSALECEAKTGETGETTDSDEVSTINPGSPLPVALERSELLGESTTEVEGQNLEEVPDLTADNSEAESSSDVSPETPSVYSSSPASSVDSTIEGGASSSAVAAPKSSPKRRKKKAKGSRSPSSSSNAAQVVLVN